MDRWNRTHEALSQAALEMFSERGYTATTTTQIAEAAGVSEMTLFRHFPTKELLLLADPFDPLLAEAARRRPGQEPVMRALTEGIRQAWDQVDPGDVSTTRARLRIIGQTPHLRGAVERHSGETIAALVKALAERGVEHRQAHVAAHAVIAGLSSALLDWAQSEDTTLDTALTSALDVLGGD